MIVFQTILCLVFAFYTRLKMFVELLHCLWCLQQPGFFPSSAAHRVLVSVVKTTLM